MFQTLVLRNKSENEPHHQLPRAILDSVVVDVGNDKWPTLLENGKCYK